MANVVDGRDLLASMLDEDTTFVATPAQEPTFALTIGKYILALLLERAAPVVPTRDVMPVLKNFQFDARPGRLRVVATDMELSMVATAELVTVDTPGIAVFPARKLMEILRKAADGDVRLRVVAGTARITVGRTTWTQKLLGGDDYPDLPVISEAVLVQVDRAGFAAALHAVRYAASKEARGSRGSLMMIDVRDGRLTACDGSRFQQATLGDLSLSFALPIGAVDALLKLLAKTDLADISIGESVNHLIFRLGSDLFIVNKVLAQFPDMDSTFLRPALANRHTLTVDRATLVTAVERVRINADAETSAIALRLGPGRIVVASRDKYGNEATETIDAAWTGPERDIVVNHAFLTDMIGAHGGHELVFHLGDDTKTRKSPVLLRNPDTGAVGVLQQMLGEWVGQ